MSPIYIGNKKIVDINFDNSFANKIYIGEDLVFQKKTNSYTFNINTSLGNNTNFALPLVNGYEYDFIVDWGDGQTSEITSWDDINKTHTYATSGTYQISITGLCEAWYFNNSGDKLKITSIDQWGDTGFINMEGSFSGCNNLATANDTDGTWCGNVTNMRIMFNSCTSLTTFEVSNWNVSNVTNMYGMFLSCSSLTTLDVSNWDVSNVKYIERMFDGCSSLTTLDMNNWNVSKVTSMSLMFQSCTSLTTLEVSNWDTSNVTSMSFMFNGCSSLTTLNLSGWNVENVLPYVTNDSMGFMFSGCPLNTTSYDATLIAWSVQNVQSGVRLDAPLTQYSSAAASARSLLESKGWTINDGGLV